MFIKTELDFSLLEKLTDVLGTKPLGPRSFLGFLSVLLNKRKQHLKRIRLEDHQSWKTLSDGFSEVSINELEMLISAMENDVEVVLTTKENKVCFLADLCEIYIFQPMPDDCILDPFSMDKRTIVSINDVETIIFPYIRETLIRTHEQANWPYGYFPVMRTNLLAWAKAKEPKRRMICT